MSTFDAQDMLVRGKTIIARANGFPADPTAKDAVRVMDKLCQLALENHRGVTGKCLRCGSPSRHAAGCILKAVEELSGDLGGSKATD